MSSESQRPPGPPSTRRPSFPPPAAAPALSGTSGPPTSRRYQDLDGGRGRSVFYRPDRYALSDLGPVRAEVVVDVDGGSEVRCHLRDVSQNGIGFEWVGRELAVGDAIQRLTVSFDGHEAYQGAARVGSVRRVDDAVVVGASLVDSLMNVDDVLHLRDVKAWRAAEASDLGLSDQSWRARGWERAKAGIAELRLFFEDAEARLREIESSLPWHVVHGGPDLPAHAALVERVQREFVTEALSWTNSIAVAVADCPASDYEKLKEFSRRHLHGHFMQAPWMYRALYKPLGYAGDYELMNGLYERRFEGSTLFAKAVNLSMVSSAAGDAVRNRKDVIRDRLRALTSRPPPRDGVHRILSIAAGPAQEVYELLRETEQFAWPVEILLFDQDRNALSFAFARIDRLMKSRSIPGANVTFRHDSIKRLLRDPTMFAADAKFDMVFACGLYDYLERQTAIALTSNLFGNVAPGGELWIGNMVPTSPSRWKMEFHLEWALIYKTHAELLDIGAAAAPDAARRIVEEPARVNPFLVLERQG